MTTSHKSKSKLLTDNAAVLKKASRNLSSITDKEAEDCNTNILIKDIRNEILKDSNTKPLENQTLYKCKIRNCHWDITFNTLEELVEHTNQTHPNYKWTKDKLNKYNCKYCSKCCKMFVSNIGLCTHLVNNNKQDMELYPQESWSITVAAIKTDVPRVILSRFTKFLDNVGCKLGIACLERGDKENNLHLQAAAEIKWNRTETKALCKKIRDDLMLDDFNDIQFKVSSKLFEAGQTWMGMVGYCQKVNIMEMISCGCLTIFTLLQYSQFKDYEIIHRGLSEKSLVTGVNFINAYRSDYTKGINRHLYTLCCLMKLYHFVYLFR